MTTQIIRRGLVIAGGIAAGLALGTQARAQDAQITFLYTDDNPANVERVGELAKEFERAHPGVTIEFVASGYDAVMKQLPLQLAVGEGPDLAKVTDNTLGRYALDMRPYMKDPDGFADLHGDSLGIMLAPGDPPDAIHGYVVSETLNLPFVNVTLFEQAGVPLPEKGATLREIVDASVQVANATGVPIPFTLDRSGHRFTGPALSYGSVYLKDGLYTFPDEAAKRYIADLYEFTTTGAFPKEMWGAAGGSRYKSMGEEFMNGQVVTYLAGNWMVGRFIDGIGDAFEWTAIDAPCGDGGCVAMPGGSNIMAFEHTKHPELVSEFVEFLGGEEVQRDLAETFVLLPGAQIPDLDYKVSDESAKNAMAVFLANRANVPVEARQLQVQTGNTAFYNAIVQRMSQLIVGEMDLEQSYAALAEDVRRINEEIAAQK